jgi:curli biogenesis system outer membrane secretion channel CsgG
MANIGFPALLGKRNREGVIVRKYGLLLLTLCLVMLSACSTAPRYYAAESLGLGYVKRVVVLPFKNHTETKFAELRFTDVVTTEILSRGLFEVVEKGEAQRFLREELVQDEQASLDQATAMRMGQELNVQAYLSGAVEDFSTMQNGSYSYPVIAATLRLVDVKTGQIIWQASGSESGYRTYDRLFGFASEDVNQVGFRLAQKLLATLSGG